MADPFATARHDARVRARRRQRAVSPERGVLLRTAAIAKGIVVVSATGEIDLANRSDLAQALAAAGADPELRLLVCDLTHVGFLACTGVSTLTEVTWELAARGAELRVVATDPVVRRVLDVTGQSEFLGVRPHLAAALTGFVQTKPPGDPPNLMHLRIALDAAVEQTSTLAELCGRLAEEVSAVDAEALVDERGEQWKPDDTLTEMAEDLRVLQNHLSTGALLAAPTVEDLRHLREDGKST